MALTVSLVLEDSIAEGLGIAVGDRLTHINGERVRDLWILSISRRCRSWT